MTTSTPPSTPKPLGATDAIILAAGQGTRMGSDLAKVLHPVQGRPMIDWVIDACEAAGCERVIVVVGHQADRVREALSDRKQCFFVEQSEQLGTGHAVMQAAPLFKTDESHATFVLCGDGPLIRHTTLTQLLAIHQTTSAIASLATSTIPDPTGYGRIVRDSANQFRAIVEQKDATEQELELHEVNPSYYCFESSALFKALDTLDNHNQNNEYYLTDLFKTFVAAGQSIGLLNAVDPEDILSINTPEQLAHIDAILHRRHQATGEKR